MNGVVVGCFGKFHTLAGNCESCKVVRSCKRESLVQLRSERERHIVQSRKPHTFQGVSDEQARFLVHSFLLFYRCPVSTYRLTKDFKRFRHMNVSDTKMLSICEELRARGLVRVKDQGDARYWFGVPVNLVSKEMCVEVR